MRSILPLSAATTVLALLAAGCDAGQSSAPGDGGADVASVFACAVPPSPPSMGSCVVVADAVACNPVTNAPCPSGQTCDVTSDSMGNITGIACFGGDNDAGLCQLCDLSEGVACAGGLSCALAVPPYSACARFCCTNADCGDAGACVTNDANGRSLFGSMAPSLGLCAAM